MGICSYCGQSAGWFHSTHEECVQRAAQGVECLKQTVADAVLSGKRFIDIEPILSSLRTEHQVPDQQAASATKDGWNVGAKERSVKEPISPDEFDTVSDLYNGVGFDEEIWRTPGGRDMTFSNLIWTVLHDQIIPYGGPIQFNLQHGEIPFFAMANVLISEQRTTSSYVGGFQGVSIRVANGLYYRLGEVRGHRAESTSLQEIDYGDFLVTTDNVYFSGHEHGTNFRIAFKQVIRFQPYTDAVGICKDASREKIFAPQHVENCGWFLFNVLQALAARDAGART